MVRISYERETGSLYLQFSSKQIVRTVEVKKNAAFIDLDAEGEAVGLEVIHKGFARSTTSGVG